MTLRETTLKKLHQLPEAFLQEVSDFIDRLQNSESNHSFQEREILIKRDRSNTPMSEILQAIRSRPRVNPISFGLLDSTTLIREDRDR